ncbi:MAG: glycosyltransferase [Chloroflexi bacterium]|nr:MAG: glycosyltransferase [Chloroflexota bacterium]
MTHIREDILGAQVSAVNMDMVLAELDSWLVERSPHYICVTPAHSIMDGYRQSDLRKIFNASGLTVPDGMAIVWILKLKGHRHVQRVYGPDLLIAASKHGLEKGYRHYFYGGAPGVPEKLVQKLSVDFPELQIAGISTPPFRPLSAEEDEEIIQEINKSDADIIWVGLGAPKQEFWMQAHLGKLNAPIMVGVGAAFDFLSGNKAQAPLWIQRSGLEWLFRFAHEPKRLWARYSQYPKFVLLIFLSFIGVAKSKA